METLEKDALTREQLQDFLTNAVKANMDESDIKKYVKQLYGIDL